MASDKNFKDIFTQSLHLYKDNWIKLFSITLVFFMPYLVLDKVFWQNEAFKQKIILNHSLNAFYLIDALLNIVIVFYAFWFFIALFQSIEAADQREPFGILKAYKKALPVWMPYSYIKWLYIIKVVGWSFLLIIPGIVFLGFYSFSGLACLITGKRGEEALILSKEIIKKTWIKYLDYMFYLLIILFAVYFPLVYVLDTVIYKFASRGDYVLTNLIVYAEIGLLILIAVFPFIFFYYLYKELSRRAELL